MRNGIPVWPLLLVGVALAAWPGAALAYVGPGIGLTVIGTFLAFVAAVFLGIVGFLWYPIRRFLRARRGQTAAPGSAEGAAGGLQGDRDPQRCSSPA